MGEVDVAAGIAAVVVIVALILGYRLVSKRPTIGTTRFGVFIERDPIEDEDDEDTQQLWPKDKE